MKSLDGQAEAGEINIEAQMHGCIILIITAGNINSSLIDLTHSLTHSLTISIGSPQLCMVSESTNDYDDNDH